MMEAIQNDRTPNFFFMHYELPGWNVRSLLLVPHFAFPPSAIIKRKPLSPTARRAGWVGCNIALSQIPQEARIFVVNDHQVQSVEEVRKKFLHVKPLAYFPATERGWTLDVLTAVRSLNKPEFTNTDAYTFAPHLEKLHPGNRHVQPKIRQQLQYLRDAGLVEHVARGTWRLVQP
jgi:type II restriction enzyme